MYINSKNVIIKYGLIFLSIFVTILLLFEWISITKNNYIDFSFLNFIILFAISVSIFLSYLFIKILKMIYICYKYLNLQIEKNLAENKSGVIPKNNQNNK